MARTNSPTELDVHAIFVDEMEAESVSRKLIRLSVDETFVERLNDKLGVPTVLEPIQTLADRCLANQENILRCNK